MNLYLSSYRIGNQGSELAAMLDSRKHVAVIRNAVDFSDDEQRHHVGRERERADLAGIGIESTDLDLRDYFGSPLALREDLLAFSGSEGFTSQMNPSCCLGVTPAMCLGRGSA
jgi:dipeptidase E